MIIESELLLTRREQGIEEDRNDHGRRTRQIL